MRVLSRIGYHGVVLLLVQLACGQAMAGVVKETVIFLQQDGRNHLVYSTARTDWPSYELYMQKSTTLDDFLYIYPNDFQWDQQSDANANILQFRQSDYALIQPGSWDAEVTIDAEGSYHFRSADGDTRQDGHFGYWTRPGLFEQFVYVWVLPANFEVISYRANVPGEWVQRHNTLAFYARQVNDLLFEIVYRPRSYGTFARMQVMLQGQDEVRIEQQQSGVRLVLGEGALFPTGSSELSVEGSRLLGRIASVLKTRAGLELSVSGHTDDRPLKGNLRRKYGSNWGLSAARALVVVQQMVKEGIAGERIRAQAYSSYRPAADNGSAEGRAKNRRIELEITESRQ